MVSFSLISTLTVLAVAVAGSKRGFAVNDEVDVSKGGVTLNGYKSKISWTYNWDSNTRKKQPYAEFVPMLWGTQSYHTNQWANNTKLWLSRGTKHLLGFNEPERPDQAALSPQQAADAWRKYMNQFSGRAKLGAPAVSNDGYNWLKDFLGKCHDCHIDFVPVHWYNDHTLEGDLENWVNKICSLVGNRKVWITEFKGFGNQDQQRQFMKKALPWLDKKACIERYAYFGTANNNKDLLVGNGPRFSPLGYDYVYHD
ncbi:hypothetical protein LMH87_010623 [Akanthomyces muscarius]|uniref:Glycoside hydrolase, superfamily n=2 Tax=Akanthomyces TaxID=150366 RepID=A0A162ITS7_CORDF|nr:hypothetical protein LMH87_010623 [Akanthomyces muscarius]KAJ4154162.1 hypothetical protein LMH87_010623 [Akanthomyces muscarius]OAA77095.1 Glycoside hydrolase, superfamily [Akanthomyces lecanii RCEF 1005]